MKVSLISIVGLIVSFVVCVAGVYGCTIRESSRWGQPEDILTFFLAGLAYLGLLGAATALTLFVRNLVLIWKRRGAKLNGDHGAAN